MWSVVYVDSISRSYIGSMLHHQPRTDQQVVSCEQCEKLLHEPNRGALPAVGAIRSFGIGGRGGKRGFKLPGRGRSITTVHQVALEDLFARICALFDHLREAFEDGP